MGEKMKVPKRKESATSQEVDRGTQGKDQDPENPENWVPDMVATNQLDGSRQTQITPLGVLIIT